MKYNLIGNSLLLLLNKTLLWVNLYDNKYILSKFTVIYYLKEWYFVEV